MTRWKTTLPEPDGCVAPGPVPTFSVIIPAYQSERFIADALSSALAQTTPAKEVIVCDDGSTDDLDAALAPFRERIVLLRKPNGGIGSAKNLGARHATGDFLVWLDHDDAWLPERLQALGEVAAERPDLDVVTTDAFLERDGKVVGLWCGDFVTEDQRMGIIAKNFVFPGAAVRRSSFLAIGGSDESLQIEDWDCWIRLVLSGSRIGLINEPLARYRLRPDSVSADDEKRRRNDFVVLSKTLGRTDLRDAERSFLEKRVAARGRTVGLFDLRAALVAERPVERRTLARIALSAGYRPGVRLRAAAGAAAPGLARRWLRHSQGRMRLR